jgi:peptide/nickel transport system permease protein
MSKENNTNVQAAELEHESLSDSVRALSPTRLVVKRFFRSRLSMVGLIIIVFLFLFSYLGPLFIPYRETQVFPIPTEVNVSTSETFVGADGEKYQYFDVSTGVDNYKAAPSKQHWLGTDTNGMDVFVRLMYGGRISLTISFLVVFLETILGVIFGGMSGYFGGKIDMLIMRIVDILNCIPTMPVLIVLSSVLQAMPVSIMPVGHRIYYLMGFLTLIGWAGVARMVRGQILSLREQEYMVAAEATGISAKAKIFRHLIPNVMPQLIVQMTLGLGSIILYEATLSYLGLGVQIPRAAWGTMISLADPSKGQSILQYYPNLWIPPGVLIVLAVLAFNFVGDGLRDAIDPKMKR